MKINEVIKQLNAIKKKHGNISVCTIGAVSGRFIPLTNISPIHPIGPKGGYDFTKPAEGVWFR